MNMFEEGRNEYVKQYLKSVSTFSISYLSFREMHQILQSKKKKKIPKNEVLSDDESVVQLPSSSYLSFIMSFSQIVELLISYSALEIQIFRCIFLKKLENV